MIKIAAIRERLRESLWVVPGIFALGSGLAAAVLLSIDRQLSIDGGAFYLFGGTPEGARSVLSTIAQSMLTFTGLVFTITMLVLQLAANQLSPRVMRTFLRDRQNQTVLGLFVATFLYTLLVLREVRSPDGGPGYVPAFSTWVAFVLLVASVAAFIYYINHMAHAIRASSVISRIAEETRVAIDRLYPAALARPDDRNPSDALPASDPNRRAISSSGAGILTAVDEDALLSTAIDADVTVQLHPFIGDFVTSGSLLFSVVAVTPSGSRLPPEDLERRLRGALNLGATRTLQQDAAFGFRQLVDIGVRALSPGTNDPTTAVQAIDQLHDLLRRLGGRSFPSPVRADEAGVRRLVLPRPDWDDYVHLAIDELRLFGAGQLQVSRRLRYLLEDLTRVCHPLQRGVLDDEIARLDRSVERDYADPADQATARQPSARGHGPATDWEP